MTFLMIGIPLISRIQIGLIDGIKPFKDG